MYYILYTQNILCNAQFAWLHKQSYTVHLFSYTQYTSHHQLSAAWKKIAKEKKINLWDFRIEMKTMCNQLLFIHRTSQTSLILFCINNDSSLKSLCSNSSLDFLTITNAIECVHNIDEFKLIKRNFFFTHISMFQIEIIQT